MNQQEEIIIKLKNFAKETNQKPTVKQMEEFVFGLIALALANRDKEIVEIVKANTPTHITREYRDTDKMRDDIINLITNK